MKEQLYTLKKKKDTEEYHLFLSYRNDKDECMTYPPSVCKEMTTEESVSNAFFCEKEQPARELIAKLGRKVCGTCVSHLYLTPKK